MPRPREHPATLLNQRFSVPMSDSMIDYLDKARGTRSRAGYVRDLIRADALRKAVK